MAGFGRFEITGELGRGGGGVVYRGLDPETGATVALKSVPAQPATSERALQAHRQLVERLRREADSVSTLQHPNIVRFIEFGEDQGAVYFAMEFVEGQTLEEALQRKQAFNPFQIVRIVSGVAEALDFAHARGIVHRDVKPGNIMLTPEGGIKVMDFGTAKLLHQTNVQQLTMVGSMVGSAHYMSPEQIVESGVGARSDQFPLAIIAWELLAGKKPFDADSMPAILFQICSLDPPALSGMRPDLSATIDAVFQRALAKSPDARYASCAEFASELRTALARPAAPARTVPAAPEVRAPVIPANQLDPSARAAIIAAASVAAVIVLVLLILLLHRR